MGGTTSAFDTTRSRLIVEGYLASTLFIPGLTREQVVALQPTFVSVVATVTDVPASAVSVAYVLDDALGSNVGGDSVQGVSVRYVVGLPAACGCRDEVAAAMISEPLLSSLRLNLAAPSRITITANPEDSTGDERPPNDDGLEFEGRLVYATIAAGGALLITIIAAALVCVYCRRSSRSGYSKGEGQRPGAGEQGFDLYTADASHLDSSTV